MLDDITLRERIARVFSDVLSVDVPAADTDLFGTGVLDSLAFVELLVQLEREFGIKTSADDLEVENFQSIARIADFVITRTASAESVRHSNHRAHEEHREQSSVVPDLNKLLQRFPKARSFNHRPHRAHRSINLCDLCGLCVFLAG